MQVAKVWGKNSAACAIIGLRSDELFMQFPEAALRSHQEFRQWYAGIRKTIQSNSHDLGDVDISKTNQGFDVEINVRWQAKTYDGKELEM